MGGVRERRDAYVVGDDLRLKHARVEAGLVDIGVLVGDAWPAKLRSCDAVGAGVEVELWTGVVMSATLSREETDETSTH